MGVDYSPVAVYGVEVDQDTVETLVMTGPAFLEAKRNSKAWHETNGYPFDEEEFKEEWSTGEGVYEWSFEGLTIVEAGCYCYGGDRLYYLGIDLSGDTDPDTLKHLAAGPLRALGIYTLPSFRTNIYVH